MKHITLEEVLKSQDMGEKNIDKICDSVLENKYDFASDPITGIVVNAFENNDYSDYEGMANDLDYAINQLTRAKKAIEAATNKPQLRR